MSRAEQDLNGDGRDVGDVDRGDALAGHRQPQLVPGDDVGDLAEVGLHELPGPQVGEGHPGRGQVILDLAVHAGETERRVELGHDPRQLDDVADAGLSRSVDKAGLHVGH